jgi:hypothetical protein
MDGGIIIYINKKHKNVLIRIELTDNQLQAKNVERDYLYNELYKELTAYNFINTINNPLQKWGFSEYLKYVIIEKDGSISEFSNTNFNNINTIITAEYPDEFQTKIKSQSVKPITLTENILKPFRKLDNSKLDSFVQLNWFNSKNYLATEISKDLFDPQLVDNYFGLRNLIFNNLWRHSGDYSPIFYNVELFNIDKFKFDTQITKFAKSKEWIISKVNRSGNKLKLRNNNNFNSIYPLLDEFGFTWKDLFLFKSTWDDEFFTEVESAPNIDLVDDNIEVVRFTTTTTSTTTVSP